MSYTSSLSPVINKLRRLPATSAIISPWSVAAKCIALVARFTACDEARYRLRIAISAYPTCIRRPRWGGCRRNIAMPFGMTKLKWLGYPTVKKI